MALDFETIDFSNQLLNVLNSRVAKVHHSVTVQADKVVVLPIPVCRFVFGLAVAKLMADCELAFQQHIQRVVDGRSANALSAPL